MASLAFRERPRLLPYLIPNPPPPTLSRRLTHNLFFSPQMAAQRRPALEFEDFLPTMAEKLGQEGLMRELCNGFRLLMDPARGLITFDSLKRNAATLGLQGLGDEELMGMVREGDMDGDGALDQMEFCVLMFRLSPELMEGAWGCVDDALRQELQGDLRI